MEGATPETSAPQSFKLTSASADLRLSLFLAGSTIMTEWHTAKSIVKLLLALIAEMTCVNKVLSQGGFDRDASTKVGGEKFSTCQDSARVG